MKYKEYIRTHQVFTVEQIAAALDSASSLPVSLDRSLKSGEIERVKRGTYVSKTGKFEGEGADPRTVVSTIDPTAVFSYHSALELYGVSHTVCYKVVFRSESIRGAFVYDGVTYVPYGVESDVAFQTVRANAFGAVNVTTKEQTIVDCLKRPGRSGGFEEVVRSLGAFRYVDAKRLVDMVEGQSDTVAAKTGWLLERKKDDWRIDDAELERLEAKLGGGPYRATSIDDGARGWSARWKLILPDSTEEMAQWL